MREIEGSVRLMAEKKLPAEIRIGFLVHDVSRMRKFFFDQAMKPLGITRSQWWVLGELARNSDEGVTQIDLARLLDIGKASLGVTIRKLEASGYVTRTTNSDDRRENRIRVTKSGRELLQQMVDVGRGLNKAILSRLTKQDIEYAEWVLEVMKENIRTNMEKSEENETSRKSNENKSVYTLDARSRRRERDRIGR